jgi:hypothetical protein
VFLPEDTMPPSIETIRQGGADQPTGQPELIKRRCNFAHHGLRLYEPSKAFWRPRIVGATILRSLSVLHWVGR